VGAARAGAATATGIAKPRSKLIDKIISFNFLIILVIPYLCS
jgi:hypothetical protein